MRSIATVVILSVALTMALVGCGGSATMTLTETEVSGIPPGNATGTTLSGSYVVVSASVENCLCRAGSCAMISPQAGMLTTIAQPGIAATIVQQDGALSITDSNGETISGAVNLDNNYSCGGPIPVPAGQGQGETLVQEDGTFQLSAGQPTGVAFLIYETIMATIGGMTYDCDLEGTGILGYEGT